METRKWRQFLTKKNYDLCSALSEISRTVLPFFQIAIILSRINVFRVMSVIKAVLFKRLLFSLKYWFRRSFVKQYSKSLLTVFVYFCSVRGGNFHAFARTFSYLPDQKKNLLFVLSALKKIV